MSGGERRTRARVALYDGRPVRCDGADEARAVAEEARAQGWAVRWREHRGSGGWVVPSTMCGLPVPRGDGSWRPCTRRLGHGMGECRHAVRMDRRKHWRGRGEGTADG